MNIWRSSLAWLGLILMIWSAAAQLPPGPEPCPFCPPKPIHKYANASLAQLDSLLNMSWVELELRRDAAYRSSCYGVSGLACYGNLSLDGLISAAALAGLGSAIVDRIRTNLSWRDQLVLAQLHLIWAPLNRSTYQLNLTRAMLSYLENRCDFEILSIESDCGDDLIMNSALAIRRSLELRATQADALRYVLT